LRLVERQERVKLAQQRKALQTTGREEQPRPLGSSRNQKQGLCDRRLERATNRQRDSGDVDRSSLCESAFSLSKRDVLRLEEIADQGIAGALKLFDRATLTTSPSNSASTARFSHFVIPSVPVAPGQRQTATTFIGFEQQP
jgi:hypothetical protein